MPTGTYFGKIDEPDYGGSMESLTRQTRPVKVSIAGQVSHGSSCPDHSIDFKAG